MTQRTPMVRHGQHVYTLDNEGIGEVDQVQGDYFTVRRGLFGLGGHLHIPFEDLHEMRGDRVYVNAVRDEVEMKGWQDPPLHPGHQGQGPTRP